ncbi:MAG: hypothetical protein Q7S40_19490 [Opitutaceae bacterium]|nr:hypothetical protein [Opitutaceae bacterium]
MKPDSTSEARRTGPMQARWAGAVALLGAALLAGCATSTEVKVDSLAKPNAESALSYELHNKNPLVADDSLRYKEAAGYVKTALSGKGMYEAPPGVKPDIVVDLDYGVGPPVSRRETVSEPVYITLPGQIRTERVQVGTDSQGRPIYQTITVQDPPTTEFAGFREYQITVTVYEKYLKLSARENAPAVEGRPPNEVWTIDVTSEGESRDLRKKLPVLVAASIEYIGKDSQGQKTIRIKDTDSDVAFVKKGM